MPSCKSLLNRYLAGDGQSGRSRRPGPLPPPWYPSLGELASHFEKLPYYFAINLRSWMILKTSPALITCYHLSSTPVTLPTCPCVLFHFPFQPTVLKKVARCVVSIGLHVILSPQLYLLFPQQH